jgi:hypothetical protein
MSMINFGKKTTLQERALADLYKASDDLRTKLAATKAALEKARIAKDALPLDADEDVTKVCLAQVREAKDYAEELEMRLTTLSDRIIVAEAQLSEAKLAAERTDAANKCSATVETYAIAVTNLERAITDTLDAQKLATEGLPHSLDLNLPALVPDINTWLTTALSEMKRILKFGRAHVEQLRTGAIPIPAAPKPEPKIEAAPPPAPNVERRPFYPFNDSRWLEPDGSTRTACAYSIVQVPAAIVVKAIKANLGDDPGSLRAVNVRSIHGIQNGPARPASECVDLESSEPPTGIKYHDEHKGGLMHSLADQAVHDAKASGADWVHKGERTGTATTSGPRSVPRY